MKTLLVNPPIPKYFYNREFYFPSSLLYLGAKLQEHNYGVKILDFKIYQNQEFDPSDEFYGNKLIEEIKAFQPDLLGFGSLFSGNFPDLLKLSKRAKESFPNLPNVIGGIHPTLYFQEILENCPSIDSIVLGEGEETLIRIIESMKGNYQLKDISGFAFRKNGKVVLNPKTEYIHNVDAIPFPAYDLVNIEDYYVDTSDWHNPKNLPINTSVPIISSRSCPNRCTFCSMYKVMGPMWRARSPENVVNEIEYVYNKFNHKHFSFMDDNFTLSKPRLIEICNEINKRKLDIQYETPNGITTRTLDQEMLEAMVSSGFIRTYLAIESGSDFIRNKVMRKGVSKEKIFEVLNLTKKYPQLSVNTFFIIGMPEETKETLNETYNMIKEINADKTIVMNIVPFPGTKVYEQAIRDNLLVGVEKEKLYLADDRYFTNYDRFFIKPYELELEDLREFREKCDKLIKKQKTNKLAEKYNERAFMYIEYPHKSFWSEKFEENDLKQGLKKIDNKTPLMLYVHIPFCERRCFYCTCHTTITSNYEKIKNYLNLLFQEIDLYKDFFDKNSITTNFVEVHLGGGSPDILKEKEFDSLIKELSSIVVLKDLDEFAIELDPRNLNKDKILYYHNQGINRISFGIQEFDLKVQKAINRVQPPELVEPFCQPSIRNLFSHGINFDILCGLPNQTPESIRETFEKIVSLAPDRVCFNYLHYSPEFYPHQKIMSNDLPNNIERKMLFKQGLKVLLDNGYIRTGYEHFAKLTDDLTKAMQNKTMYINALGVTPGRYTDIIGIGPHSASTLGDYYFQNTYGIENYKAFIENDKFPTFRGYKLNNDDIIRRDVIRNLRNFFSLDYKDIEKKHNINFKEYFKEEIIRLDDFVKDGIAEVSDKGINITELGQEFVLFVCANFDSYK